MYPPYRKDRRQSWWPMAVPECRRCWTLRRRRRVHLITITVIWIWAPSIVWALVRRLLASDYYAWVSFSPFFIKLIVQNKNKLYTYVVSLLLALLSLIFLLKISPGGREPPPPPPGPISSEDYIIVYDVTLALCALSLSLNLCCLLVCAIQFLFAVKLVRAPATSGR